MKRELPPLRRPVGDPDGFGLGVRKFGGWTYACRDCGAECDVRVRWKHRGNKANGWALMMTPAGPATFCAVHAVAELRRRAALKARTS